MDLSRLTRRPASAAVAIAMIVAIAAFSPPAKSARTTALSDAASRSIEADWVRAHLDSVLRELPQHDTRAFTSAQREHRETLLATLKIYRDRGDFPRNYDFPGKAVPYFTDRKTGTLCAVGYLLASTGRQDIVDRVTRANNNVRVRQLAGDTALAAWLDQNGITLDEAARIQVMYVQSGPFDLSPSQIRRVAMVAVTPFALAGAVITSTWNVLGNSDGHRMSSSVTGIVSGIVSVGIGAELSSMQGIPKSSGMIMAGVGGASIAFAVRSLVHRHDVANAVREEQKTVIVHPIVSPTISMGKNPSAGFSVSMQF
jgi:hypothetical protein